jgi:UTP--glucose-1-phosphate uridylyltransferase
VTRTGKEAIENHFDAHYELEHTLEKKGKEKILGTVRNILPEGVTVTSIRQRDPLGLGHAVLCARHLLNNEPFAVLLPDVLVLDRQARGKNFSFAQLIAAWNRTGIGQIMVESVGWETVEGYGVVDVGDETVTPFSDVKVKGLVEKPTLREAPSNLAVLGRYVLPNRILDLLEHLGPGVGGEIQLTDALDDLIKLEELNALETDALTFDCGNKKGFLGANVAVGLQDARNKDYLKTLINNLD